MGVCAARVGLVRLVVAPFCVFRVGSAHPLSSVPSTLASPLPFLSPPAVLSLLFLIQLLSRLTALWEGFRTRSQKAC